MLGAKNLLKKRIRGLTSPGSPRLIFFVYSRFRGSNSSHDWVAGEARAGSFVVTLCQSWLPTTRFVVRHCLTEDRQAVARFTVERLFSRRKIVHDLARPAVNALMASIVQSRVVRLADSKALLSESRGQVTLPKSNPQSLPNATRCCR